MTTEVATRENGTPLPEAVEKVLLEGDLSKLSAEQRVLYYNRVCHSLALNPLTRPFDYIRLNNRLVLYAKKDATEQLRKIHGVSIEDIEDQLVGDVYRVKAKAKDREGRTDFAVGAVAIANLKGESLANAYMKAETKAKRRVTLSICGLGMLDETEVDSIPGAEHVDPEKPVALITEEQRGDLETLLENTSTDVGKFCEFFHLKSLADMPADEYGRAVKALEAKAKRGS